MSGKRVVFDAIIEKIKSIRNKYGEATFKTVELSRGQMMRIKGFENTEKVIMFPAVFIKPEEIISRTRPQNVNLVEMRIRFYVATNELIRSDELDIFDLPETIDRYLLDSKWDTDVLVSIKKGQDMMPETWDNTQVYELNYWIKYWDLNAYQFREWVDANDPEVNPNAPVDPNLDAYINDDEPYGG